MIIKNRQNRLMISHLLYGMIAWSLTDLFSPAEKILNKGRTLYMGHLAPNPS